MPQPQSQAAAPETLVSPLPADMPAPDEQQGEMPIHAQPAADAPKQIMWTVEDANCKAKDARGMYIPRIHDMGLDSGPIQLFGIGRPVPLPVHVAMRFLIDPAFIVKNERGQRVQPVSKANIRPSDGAIMLQPGQIVARFDELSEDALRARTAMLPAVDPSFATYATREQMLAALTQHEIEQRRIPSGSDDAATLAAAPGGAAAPATMAWLDKVMPKPAAA